MLHPPNCLLLLSQKKVLDKHIQCVKESFLWISDLVNTCSIDYVPSFEVTEMSRHKHV